MTIDDAEQLHRRTTGTSPTDFQPQDAVTMSWPRATVAVGGGRGPGNCSSSFGMARMVRAQAVVTLANSNGSTQAVFSSICTVIPERPQVGVGYVQAACGQIIL
jgi:hypothetical protein